MDAVKLGGFANYSAEKLAVLCFASVRSARRWKQTGFAPAIAVAWLELTHYGALNRLSLSWDAWRIRDDELHAPNGYAFTPGELIAIPLLHQQLATLRRESEELREQLARASSLSKTPALCSRRKFARHALNRLLKEQDAERRAR